MTLDQLQHQKEAEDKIEFKAATHNFPYNGGSHINQEDRRKSDLQDIVTQYYNRSAVASTEEERESHYFSITKQEIAENGYDLSLSKYKREVHEEITYETPTKIFNRLERIEENIIKGIIELKELV